MDDGGFGDIGGDEISTVHIDSIRNNGINFDNAYLTTPQCSPSRVGVLSVFFFL